MKPSKKADPKQDSDSNSDSPSDPTTSLAPAANTKRTGKDSLPPNPPNPSPFKEGETVVASHSGLYYLAKVEKVVYKKDWKYHIHYTGWSRSWDERVGLNRLWKRTEENLKKVTNDKKRTMDKYVKPCLTSGIKSDESLGERQKKNSTLVGQKRKREPIMSKGKDNEPTEKPFSISIYATLRKQLVDDCEFVNQMGKLVRLPRNPNVDTLIQNYREYRGKKDCLTSASVGEVLSGLSDYFNKALPVILLYNKEREQYQKAITEEPSQPSPSSVYGAEHLLRLFVKLPALLNELDLDKRTARELQQDLQGFLKFLQKNQSIFFLSTYFVPEDSRSTDKVND